jgi:hypothetical protein
MIQRADEAENHMTCTHSYTVCRWPKVHGVAEAAGLGLVDAEVAILQCSRGVAYMTLLQD